MIPGLGMGDGRETIDARVGSRGEEARDHHQPVARRVSLATAASADAHWPCAVTVKQTGVMT